MRPLVRAPREGQAPASLYSRADSPRRRVLVAVYIGRGVFCGLDEADVEVFGVPAGDVGEGAVVYFVIVVVDWVVSVSCLLLGFTIMEDREREEEEGAVPRKPWLNFPSVVKLYTKPWARAEAAKPKLAKTEVFIFAIFSIALLLNLQKIKNVVGPLRAYSSLHPLLPILYTFKSLPPHHPTHLTGGPHPSILRAVHTLPSYPPDFPRYVDCIRAKARPGARVHSWKFQDGAWKGSLGNEIRGYNLSTGDGNIGRACRVVVRWEVGCHVRVQRR